MLQYQQPATDLNHTRPALSTLATIASDHSSHLRYVIFFYVYLLYHSFISISAPVVWFGSGEDDNRNEKRHAEVQEYMYVCTYVCM